VFQLEWLEKKNKGLDNNKIVKNKLFIFFDLGQTLIDEWDFINYIDDKFLELLNGFGARIDLRNYHAIRDSIIRERRIGYGSIKELITETCKLVLPTGYDKVILRRLEPEINYGRKEYFKFFEEARPTLEAISKYDMGIIANQSKDIVDLLQESGLAKYFKVQAISSLVSLNKPDRKIFEIALNKANRHANECIMIGDRLDTDICPANTLGMTTIRTTNSLFALQTPSEKCEQPSHTIAHLTEIPATIEKIKCL
jgi:HAD superfamily hydrolase (TIGR01549 family)